MAPPPPHLSVKQMAQRLSPRHRTVLYQPKRCQRSAEQRRQISGPPLPPFLPQVCHTDSMKALTSALDGLVRLSAEQREGRLSESPLPPFLRPGSLTQTA